MLRYHVELISHGALFALSPDSPNPMEIFMEKAACLYTPPWTRLPSQVHNELMISLWIWRDAFVASVLYQSELEDEFTRNVRVRRSSPKTCKRTRSRLPAKGQSCISVYGSTKKRKSQPGLPVKGQPCFYIRMGCNRNLSKTVAAPLGSCRDFR